VTAKKTTPKAKKTAVTAKKTAVTAKKTAPKAKKTAPKAKKTAPKAKKTAPKAKKASAKFEKQKLKEDQISKTRVKETNNKITEKRKQKLNTIKRQPPKQVIPSKLDYEIGEYVVYPSHGVGKVTAIEDKLVGEQTLKMFVVIFDKEKMKLRVPVDKTTGSGMRHLSSPSIMEKAISTLKGKARQRRIMWSRRAQEYDAKLNSGDPVAIAEVIRDLFRKGEEPEQSYSERQMYEAAMERLAREYAALEETDTLDATERLEEVLKAA
ncbi:MAG: CarD family transcriptional regulator, partial [Rhodospirillaceae bacterium]|nr:CarD family transcriptional regulator [Rhodospirillaceae bacterium]